MSVKRLFVLLMIFMAFGTVRMNAQFLALKTDGLLDVNQIPNLTLEAVTSGKTSVNITMLASKKIWGNKFRTVGFMPEFRYWFNGRPMTRFFVGAALVGGAYDIEIGKGKAHKKCYYGDVFGAGMTFGYIWRFNKHWALDLHSGIGGIYYDQHRYNKYAKLDDQGQYNQNNYDTKKPYNLHGWAILPMGLGVSAVYIIK